MESVIAAVRSGADAVYLGERRFSARSSAHNFDEDALREAVRYCHIHGVKVYVTLNTIVFDDEFTQLADAIRAAAKADVDALIVQNMGVARLARKIAPDLPLHASTQMSVHTVSGVRALWEMGFKRVVLAREMSAREIRECAEVPVELEVFVHGALCMSVSGQCYFSAMLGSRSGNRGACAQTCRLPFAVGGQKSGHALSLKDNSLIPQLGELEAMGVASAKIEGRMKRPEYVAAAVAACREQRDFGFVTEETERLLRGVFSRTGFTDGYFAGRIGKEMFGTRTKGDVVSADEKLFSAIRARYKDEIQNIDIRLRFSAQVGKAPVLTVSDGKNTVSVAADCVCEEARSVALSEEKCRAQLQKTGGTAYRVRELTVELENNLSLPLSALNSLRRQALAALDEKRASVHHYAVSDFTPEPPVPFRSGGCQTRARMTGTKLGSGFRSTELCFVPLFADMREIERLKSEGYSVGVEIPRGMFGREKQISGQLSRVREIGVIDALCENIGALALAKEQGFVLHGGFGLNLVNTYDLLWAQEYGIKDVTLSFELTFERIRRLGGEIGRGIISYGHLPLMLCRACPNKSAGIDCKSCKNQSKMTDRKGKQFYLRCGGGAVEVLNCDVLYIAPKELSELPLTFHIQRFSVENYVEKVERTADITHFSMLKEHFTRGLYRRGVE